VDFCQKREIAVIGFSPLGSSGYVEIGMDRGQSVGLLKDPVVAEIAGRYGKSAAQVLLRWGVQVRSANARRECERHKRGANKGGAQVGGAE